MTEIQKHNFGDSAVIVARVSTPQQTESPQLEDLREYAKGLGFKNIKEFGTTESGFLEIDDKQGWNLVVDFFENHPEYKTLVCTELIDKSCQINFDAYRRVSLSKSTHSEG